MKLFNYFQNVSQHPKRLKYRFKEWDGVGGKTKDNNYSTLTLSAIYLVFHLNLNT